MAGSVDHDRRSLLTGLLAAAAWRPLRAMSHSSTSTLTTPLIELSHDQVRIGASVFERQIRENRSLVMGLNEDSLLMPYRVRAGLPAPGFELGGWYNSFGFAPGANFGQWMSALARFYAMSGDDAIRAKVARLVRGYAATIDEKGSFFRRNRFPCYTYDKLVGGLLDAARFCADDAALATLERATDAAIGYLPPQAIPRNEHRHVNEFSQYSWDESYTLPENQFLAWHASGKPRHLEIGRRLLYDNFFGALARGENVLPGKHAYSHVNALSSAMQAYLHSGNLMYLKAAMRGFDMITAQSFATGAWGPEEHFIVPGSGALGASIERQRNSFETPCGAYAHLKLTRYLLRVTRDSRYGDSMERVMYNTVLGALPIREDGHAFYYSDYSLRARKAFHPHRWPCCSGTLPLIAADYCLNACFADAEGLFVNLYVPAVVHWIQTGTPCTLDMATDYPYDEDVSLTLRLPATQTFTLNLRVPAWSQGASLRVNGAHESVLLEPGRFAVVRRKWQSGDRVELKLPLCRRIESVDPLHPDLVALSEGPLVLMQIADENGTPSITRDGLLAAQRDPTSREWRVMTTTASGSASRPVKLKAFPDIGAEDYSAYQPVVSS